MTVFKKWVSENVTFIGGIVIYALMAAYQVGSISAEIRGMKITIDNLAAEVQYLNQHVEWRQ